MTRDTLDRYYTPDAVALACVGSLKWWPAPGRNNVHEPHVGGGAFARAIRARWGRSIVLTVADVDPSAPGLRESDPYLCSVRDFLSDAAHRGRALIVGNPPYASAEAHVRTALARAPMVGFLLRLSILGGLSRGRGLWREHPPSSVHVLSGRPSFTGGGTDTSEYAWIVWGEPGHTGPPVLGWLDWRGVS